MHVVSDNSSSGLCGRWLFLDASGLTTCVGLWEAGAWRAYRENSQPAIESLVDGAQAVLADAAISWPQIAGFLYVAGPGSVLGLRLAAMAIRAWQAEDLSAGRAARPVRAVNRLRLAAALARAGGAHSPFAVFTEARQHFWHVLRDDAAPPEIPAEDAVLLLDDHELAALTGALYHLPARKTWSAPPASAAPLPATLREHPEVILHPGLFRAAATATPFTGKSPEYRKWAGSAAKSLEIS